MATVNSNEVRILGSIKLAADDPSKLRRIDVFRVLSDVAQQGLLLEAAEYIISIRPDLKKEVLLCLKDLGNPDEPTVWCDCPTSDTADIIAAALNKEA